MWLCAVSPNFLSPSSHDKEKIQGWKPETKKILGVFDVRDSSQFPALFALRALKIVGGSEPGHRPVASEIHTNERRLVGISGSAEVNSHPTHPKRFLTLAVQTTLVSAS